MWINWVPVRLDMFLNLWPLQHPAQTVGLPALGFEALRAQLGACWVGVWGGIPGCACYPVSNLCTNSVLFPLLLHSANPVGPLGGKPRPCSTPVPTPLVVASLCAEAHSSLHPICMWHTRLSMFMCTGATETPSFCQNHRSGLLGVSRPCPPLVRVQVLLFTLSNSQQVI